MEIIAGLGSIQPPQVGVHLTIGNFDGLHLGHRALVAELLKSSNQSGEKSALLTFYPHPVEVLYPEGSFLRMFPLQDLEEQLSLLGLDLLVIEKFTDKLASLSPEEFWTRWIQARLQPARVIVGHDFSFGAGKSGDIRRLQEFAKRYHFDLKVVQAIKMDGEIVSSSKIRELIRRGKMGEASRFLGRPFTVSGKVIRGRQVGRTLGFATANLAPLTTLLPTCGVYFTQTSIAGGQWAPSITNVGRAPTVTVAGGESGLKVETHILDHSCEELYDQELRIGFFDFVRSEKKFDNMMQLKAQIEQDVKEAKRFWKEKGPGFGLK